MNRNISAFFAFLLIGLVLCGCGDPKIDGSTDEKFRNSIEKVKTSLPEIQREKFEKAITIIALGDVTDLGTLAKLGTTEAFRSRLNERLNGKTGKEILALAEQIENERNKQNRKNAIKEIEELRKKLFSEKPDVLEKFTIELSRFCHEKVGFINANYIELSVRNNTGKAVSRAYFRGVLLSPGREIPWVEEEFNYDIPGGLEPGESALWKLSPFGQWDKAPNEREDLILAVRVIGLDGADGKSMAGEPFTKDDIDRLKMLMEGAKYPEDKEMLRIISEKEKDAISWIKPAVAKTIKNEIEYLKEKQLESDNNRLAMDKFVIDKPRFYYSNHGYSSDPVIEMTVMNGTEKTISRFYCHGKVLSPERKIPWIEKDSNYTIKGGLQPGEKDHYKTTPNIYLGWGNAPQDRNDLTLALEVYRLDGPSGESLFPINFTEEQANRLSALEKIKDLRD